MSKQEKQLQKARELLQDKEYGKARKLLKKIDHPTARKWLARVDEIAPEEKKRRGGCVAVAAILLLVCGGLYLLMPGEEGLPTIAATEPAVMSINGYDYVVTYDDAEMALRDGVPIRECPEVGCAVVQTSSGGQVVKLGEVEGGGWIAVMDGGVSGFIAADDWP